MYKMIFEGLIR